MRILRSIATATVAAALAVSVPVTSANAAVRANAAVPAASGTPSAASSRGGIANAWPAWLIAALAAALAVHILTKSNGNGKLPISRG